ncbi:hypothetical protein OS493_006946 [Desmophyllum pertusum]|uniref:Uncharacterized protein n=1 Tax=Desmophyllum pertusum TaxID=174260 RepID=A0A9W9ZS98_9CNID|nr:hypothetical protein OS493_006946 [Desmophyllum pertusum]
MVIPWRLIASSITALTTTTGRVETVGTWEIGKLKLNTSVMIWNNGPDGKYPALCLQREMRAGISTNAGTELLLAMHPMFTGHYYECDWGDELHAMQYRLHLK